MRTTIYIIALATFVAAGAGAALAGQPTEQAYSYGLTGNDWWVAKANVARPAPPRPEASSNARAPWAASVSANGQGTN